MQYRHPDLHLHSNVSDGSDSPLELLEKVRASGVDIFALTDHDAYSGCGKILAHIRKDDPLFLGGIELSCRDEFGKYHIIGYCYNVNKPSIREAAEVTHRARREKAENRFRFLEESCGFRFTEEEKAALLQNENPGKPHFVALLLEKGCVRDKAEGFALMERYHGRERRLRPEEAIDAIFRADGIPVLAHGILEDGGGLLSEEELSARLARLKDFGLMGLECYYSSFTPEQTRLMLAMADRYNLLVTAGSDYHGKNKTVALGESGDPDPARMERFYRAVYRLLEL